MQTTIKWTRRLTIAIVAISAVAVLVGASVIANYIIHSANFRVTGSPGLTAYDASGVAVTSIAFGDIQQSGPAQTFQLSLKNTGGTQTLYILGPSTNTATGAVGTVSSLNPSGLPAGVSLSWNVPTIQGAAAPITCTFNSVVYTGCVALSQGSSTPLITLSLSASSSATPTATAQSFSIEFLAYNTPTG